MDRLKKGPMDSQMKLSVFGVLQVVPNGSDFYAISHMVIDLIFFCKKRQLKKLRACLDDKFPRARILSLDGRANIMASGLYKKCSLTNYAYNPLNKIY